MSIAQKRVLCVLTSLALSTISWLPAVAQVPTAPVRQASSQSRDTQIVNAQSLGSTNLAVPSSQNLLVDFSSIGQNGLQLSDLTNHGAVYVFTTNPNVRTAAITANNILNANGAIMTSALPSAISQAVALNIGRAASSFNLSLTALNSFVNNGTISSSGNLSIISNRH